MNLTIAYLAITTIIFKNFFKKYLKKKQKNSIEKYLGENKGDFIKKLLCNIINIWNWIALIIAISMRKIIWGTFVWDIFAIISILELGIMGILQLLFMVLEALKKEKFIDNLIKITVVILFFDIVGIFSVLLGDNYPLEKSTDIFEKIEYHDSKKDSVEEIYYELSVFNALSEYRIVYDNIDFFDVESFLTEVQCGNVIKMVYTKEDGYNSVVGIEKDGLNYFSQSAYNILNINQKKWKRWIKFSIIILVGLWGIFFIVSLLKKIARLR